MSNQREGGQDGAGERRFESGIEDLAARLVRAVPSGVAALRSELEQNFRVLLQAQIERLQLVSRERFELQAERLTRAQQRVALLEARLAVLEDAANEGPRP